MRALVCNAFGPPESMTVEERPTPEPGEGEARVRMASAGLNFADLLIVQGKYQWKPDLPYVPGIEGAGVVEALGSGVTGLNVGDRVIVNAGHTLAEQAIAPIDRLLPMPENMSFRQAGGFVTTYATSYYALKQRARLQPGETMLVLGAAGGVGVTAIEIGKLLGARVIAAASSPEKLDYCRSMGADDGVDYTRENLKDRVKALTGGDGVDVVYDPVGGDYSESAFRAIAWGGRHLVIGFAAGPIPKLPLNLTLLKGADVLGVWWGGWAGRFPEESRRNFLELLDLVRRGDLNPQVSEAHSLDDYAAAFGALAERRARGKVVVEITSSETS